MSFPTLDLHAIEDPHFLFSVDIPGMMRKCEQFQAKREANFIS